MGERGRRRGIVIDRALHWSLVKMSGDWEIVTEFVEIEPVELQRCTQNLLAALCALVDWNAIILIDRSRETHLASSDRSPISRRKCGSAKGG